MPQKAHKQVPSALALAKIDIADKLCAALAPLQCDLAAMEGLQLGSMRYAYDGDLGQFVDEHLHHLVLTFLIEC